MDKAINEIKKRIQEEIIRQVEDNSLKLVYINEVIDCNDINSLLKVVSNLESKGLNLKKINNLLSELIDNDCYDKTTPLSHRVSKSLLDALIIKTTTRYENNDAIVTTKAGNEINSWETLKEVLSEIYKQTNQLMFYIPSTHEIKGRITQQLFKTKKQVTLMYALRDKSLIKDGVIESQVFFIGEKGFDRRKWVPVGNPLKYNCFIYDFHTNNHERILVLYHKKLELKDYIIKGIKIDVNDFTLIGDNHKINTTLPLFIPHSDEIKTYDVKFDDESFKEFVSNHSYDEIINHVFKQYKQPSWFMDFVLATLISAKYNGYPIHVFMIGEGESGKSTLIENIHSCYDEPISIIDGTGSTFKALIPSFKNNPPSVGGFVESKRICIVDEFLRLISRNTNMKKDSVVTALGSMNTLLEHKSRQARSGVADITTNPTARAWFVSNPVYKGDDMINLINKLGGDIPFITRFVTYFQTKQHTAWIDAHKREVNDELVITDNISIHEWLGFVDYLTSKQVISSSDLDELNKVYDEIYNSLPLTLREIFRSRYFHHLKCLLDGLVKVRCLREGITDFRVKPVDYVKVKELMLIIVNSWTPDELNNLPHSIQLEYVSYKARVIFDLINDNKGLFDSELNSGLFSDIKQVRHYLKELINLELVFFDDKRNKWYPYTMRDYIDKLNNKVIE